MLALALFLGFIALIFCYSGLQDLIKGKTLGQKLQGLVLPMIVSGLCYGVWIYAQHWDRTHLSEGELREQNLAEKRAKDEAAERAKSDEQKEQEAKEAQEKKKGLKPSDLIFQP